MARTSALERSAMEHMSSPARRAAAARMSGSFCTGIEICCSIVALLAKVFSSCGVRGVGWATESCGMFSKNLVERRNGGIHVGALQNVRRQESESRVAGAVDYDTALEHLGYREFSEFGRIKFGREHQSLAADVNDGIMSRCENAKPLLEVVAKLHNVRQYSVAFHCINHRNGNGAGQGAAAKGGPVHACVNRARSFLCAEDSSKRNAPRKRLGQRGRVRANSVVLIGAPLARAAHARLNLIDDQQRAR